MTEQMNFLQIQSDDIDFSLRLIDGVITGNANIDFGATTFNVSYDDGDIIITNAAGEDETFDSNDLEGFLRLLAYQNLSQNSINTGDRSFEFRITDPESVVVATSTIVIERQNDAPVPVALTEGDAGFTGTVVDASSGEMPAPIITLTPSLSGDISTLTGDDVRAAIADGASAEELGLISVADLLDQLNITDIEEVEFALAVISADESQGHFEYVRTGEGLSLIHI